MESNFFYKSVVKCFSNLIEKKKGLVFSPINNDESLCVKIHFNYFSVILETYHREVQVLIFKIDKIDEQINLFNVLNFLERVKGKSVFLNEFNYIYTELKNDETLIKYTEEQLMNISNIININFSLLEEFFNNRNYYTQLAELKEFMKKEYPDLF